MTIERVYLPENSLSIKNLRSENAPMTYGGELDLVNEAEPKTDRLREPPLYGGDIDLVDIPLR